VQLCKWNFGLAIFWSTDLACIIIAGIWYDIRTWVAMHCRDRFWFVCDPLLWLFHLFLHRQPCNIALQGLCGSRSWDEPVCSLGCSESVIVFFSITALIVTISKLCSLERSFTTKKKVLKSIIFIFIFQTFILVLEHVDALHQALFGIWWTEHEE